MSESLIARLGDLFEKRNYLKNVRALNEMRWPPRAILLRKASQHDPERTPQRFNDLIFVFRFRSREEVYIFVNIHLNMRGPIMGSAYVYTPNNELYTILDEEINMAWKQYGNILDQTHIPHNWRREINILENDYRERGRDLYRTSFKHPWMLQIVYPFQSPVLNIRHKYPKLITDEGDDIEYVRINKSGDEQQQIMTAIDEGKRLTYDDAERLNEMILHTGVPYVGKQKNGAQPTFNLYNIVNRFNRRTMRHPDYSINDNPYGEELPLPPPPPREPLGDTRPAHLRSKTRIAPRTNPNPPGARRRTRKGRRKAKKKGTKRSK